jgi:DNA polymerase III sliding clamp (beta) subunit (PCNA family)
LPANVIKEGEALILPKLLQAILSTLPEDEDIELGMSASGAKLQVKYGSIKSEIAVHADGQKGSEILKTIPFNAKSSTSISAATLVDIINRTLFCTATGSAAISEGPWLSSVSVETGDGVVLGTATNKIIAGRAEVPDGLVTSGYSVGVHRDALIALKALLSKREKEEVTITNASSTGNSSTNEVLFRFSDVILGVRQLSTLYPKAVDKIFTTPSNFNRATINRKLLLSCLGRLGAFAEKNALSITLSTDKVTLYTKGYNSIFQEQVGKTEKTDGSVTIGLGIADLTNVLSAMESEDVVLHYKSDNDHVHFQEGESNFKYVLSPVAVAWATKVKAA